MLLETDKAGRTVFHIAARNDKGEVFQGMFNCVKKYLTKEEVNKLLLVTDNNGNTVFHNAAKKYNVVEFREC